MKCQSFFFSLKTKKKKKKKEKKNEKMSSAAVVIGVLRVKVHILEKGQRCGLIHTTSYITSFMRPVFYMCFVLVFKSTVVSIFYSLGSCHMKGLLK